MSDLICQKCGSRNPTWYADNDLFNQVNGSANGVLCPHCFQELADSKSINIIFKAEDMAKDDKDSGRKTSIKVSTREWCDCCHNYSPVSFWVPDEIWSEVSMGKFQHLCIMCFAKRADERLIEWGKNIVFYPFSLASDLNHNKMKTGIEIIAEERQRQIVVEGWTVKHDAEHRDGQLAKAASVYALPEKEREYKISLRPVNWPWALEWWKPSPDDRIKELAKAGALIAAEIDRLNHKP